MHLGESYHHMIVVGIQCFVNKGHECFQGNKQLLTKSSQHKSTVCMVNAELTGTWESQVQHERQTQSCNLSSSSHLCWSNWYNLWNLVLIEMLLYKGRSRDEAYILEVLMIQCIPCCYPLAWLQNQCFREQINSCRLKSWYNGRQILRWPFWKSRLKVW
jgi:hypothetical protein